MSIIATPTIIVSPTGGNGDLPVFADTPGAISHIYENFSAYSTKTQIGSINRGDGGAPWAAPASAYQTLLTTPVHPFGGAGKTLQIDWPTEPGGGANWPNGLRTSGSNWPFLNAQDSHDAGHDCWVQEQIWRAIDMGEARPYVGKILDWTNFQGTNYRYDMDGPCWCGFPLGHQGVSCASDQLCSTYFIDCDTPRYSGVPPECDWHAPSLNLEFGQDVWFYREMMNYSGPSDSHDWGDGGAATLDEAWRRTVQRFTRGTSKGYGRVEQWMQKAGYPAVKTINIRGGASDVGPYGETGQRGQVQVQAHNLSWWTDIDGSGNGAESEFLWYDRSAVAGLFVAPARAQLGLIHVWTHAV